MSDKTFFSRLYCLEKDSDEWGSVVAGGGSRPSGSGDDPDGTTKLRYEYLRTVFKEESYYSIPKDISHIDTDGNLENTTETSYFQVLGTCSGSSRPKLVKTSINNDEDEARMHAPLAVSVQHLDVWLTRSPTRVTAYFETDPEYVNALDLSSWDKLRTQLRTWDETLSDTKGCIDLSNPQNATPTLAITDEQYPTVMLLEQLRDWAPYRTTINHDDDKQWFDSRRRNAKRYFQCLLTLPLRRAANPVIVSDQPISYFNLVLKDVAVEAGLGDAHYKSMLKRLAGGDDAMVPAILNAPPALALENDSDGDFDVADNSRPEPKPKRPRKTAVPKAPLLALPPAPVSPVPVAPLVDESLHFGDTDSSSSSSSSSGTSAGSFDVAHGRSTVGNWITLDLPTPVSMKLDRYKAKGKPEYLRFICRCVHHGKKCTKNAT
jgi:hypothetical protein